MSIDRTERAEIAIAPINPVGCRRFLFLSTCPAFAGLERDRLRRFGADRKVANWKTVALNQDLGDPAAVADLPIGFIAQGAARRGLGDFRSLQQRKLGFGTGEPLLDDVPEAIPFAAPIG